MSNDKLAPDEAEAFCSCGWGVRASANDPRVTRADWKAGSGGESVPPVAIAGRLVSRLVIEHRARAHAKVTTGKHSKNEIGRSGAIGTPNTPEGG